LGAGAGIGGLGIGATSDAGKSDGTAAAEGIDNNGGADGAEPGETSGSPSASGSSPNRESASECASSTGNWDRTSAGHVN
jgi:hypothetical protein